MNEITDAQFSAAVERVIERQTDAAVARWAFDGVEPPEAEPAFQSLKVDEVGWLWAQTYQASPDDEVTWLLFDSDGRGRGSVVMPKDFSVSTVSRDYVAGVWQDELGAEYVRLYRIDGRP